MPLPKPNASKNVQRTLVVDDDWWLLDPAALSWEVFELEDEQTETSATAKTAVDLVADRVSVGHYVADLSGEAFDPGTYFVRWYATDDALDGGAEVSWDGPPFDVLDDPGSVLPGRDYALVSDLRREGVAASYSDARCLRAINVASRRVELLTGRRFGFEARAFRVDHFGASGAILLDEPIVALSRVSIGGTDGVEPVAGEDIGRSLLRVYNRHLSQALESPDDREAPKVELIFDTTGLYPAVPMAQRQGLRWPLGRQDILLAGAFGYTEPDGSPMGRVPELIRHVTLRLALLDLEQVASSVSAGSGGSSAGVVKREKTRDQEVEYHVGTGAAGTSLVGALTGDPAVDTILAAFSRPPRLGAA